MPRSTPLRRAAHALVLCSLATRAFGVGTWDKANTTAIDRGTVGAVCKSIFQDVGYELPRQLRCACEETATGPGAYQLYPGLSILPHLNEPECHVDAAAHTTCTPLTGLKPGVRACSLGRLDITLRADRAAEGHADGAGSSSSGEGGSSGGASGHVIEDDWFMHLIKEQYRNHSCAGSTGTRHVHGQQQQHAHADHAQHGGGEQAERSHGSHAECMEDASTQRIRANVLDYGADPTGKQLQWLSEHVDGEVVGYNIKDDWFRPVLDTFEHAGNFTFVWGDPQACLPFPDGTFDYVYSVNVMEHAHPMEKWISEILRVLKPGGLFHARWYPNWSSARGHHIHADMIHHFAKEFAAEGEPRCADVTYENDGRTIPDWSHLYMDEAEFGDMLRGTSFGGCPKLIEYVLETVYRSNGLSRVSVFQIMQFLESTGAAELSKVSFNPGFGHDEKLSFDVVKRLADKFGHTDVLIGGAELWITRRAGPLPGTAVPASSRPHHRRR